MINDRIRVLIGVAEKVVKFSDLPAGVLFVEAPAVEAGDVPGYFDELSVKLTPGHAAVLGRSYVRYMPPDTPVQEAIPTVEYVAPPSRLRHNHSAGSGECSACEEETTLYDYGDQDRRTYREELNERPKPSEY